MVSKRVNLILLSINLLITQLATACTPPKEESSYIRTAAWCAVGAGTAAATITLAPIVIPTGIAIGSPIAMIVAAKTVAIGVAIKGTAAVIVSKAAIAAPIATKINAAIFVGWMTKKLVYQSPEEKLQALKKEDDLELAKAKLALQNCITQHKMSENVNVMGFPSACNEHAMLFGMLAENKIYKN